MTTFVSMGFAIQIGSVRPVLTRKGQLYKIAPKFNRMTELDLLIDSIGGLTGAKQFLWTAAFLISAA